MASSTTPAETPSSAAIEQSKIATQEVHTGIINDLASGIEQYINDSVTVKITDVAVEVGSAGDAVNVGETFKFKVRVENEGPISMTDVSLHVSGSNGTTISTEGVNGPFLEGIQTFGSLTVEGDGGSTKSRYIHFKAPSNEQPANTELCKAHIFDWSGSFDGLFANHTLHSAFTEGTYSDQVFP